MKEFKPASQDALRFKHLVVETFVSEVLGIKQFFITDDSRVSHFRPAPAEDGVVKDGKWEFTTTYYDAHKVLEQTGKHLWQMTEEERAPFELTNVTQLEHHEVSFLSDIIKKTEEIFGVTLTEADLGGTIMEVGQAINRAISKEKADEVKEKYGEEKE